MSLTVQAEVPERGVDLELEIPSGTTTALVGPNGAGKSTLLALIGGTLRPHCGRIVLEDRVLVDIADGRARTWVPPHARLVATLGQDPALFPHLTALGNIMFGLRARGIPTRRAKTEARDRLEQIGLLELADRRPAQLSGGQAQQVAVARALATEPRLLLLDEPMAGVNPALTQSLLEHIRRIADDGMTIVLVEHDMDVVMGISDWIVCFASGEIIAEGTPEDIGPNPSVIDAYLGSSRGESAVTGDETVRPDGGGTDGQ